MEEIKQPSLIDEQELMDINDDAVISVPIGGKNIEIGYIKPYTCERITALLVKSDIKTSREIKTEFEGLELMKENSKRLHQFAAYGILNNFFKIKLWHWIKWRWMYYIDEINYNDLMLLTSIIKKKVPLAQYMTAMGLAGTIRETVMTMTKTQAQQYRQELLSVQERLSEQAKGMNGQ